MTAASKKNIEAVRALIDAGANTNLTRMQNVTALHEATLIGDLESSTILLEHGAQPGAKALQDVTPLHNAASSGNVKLMALLVDRGAPVNCKTARSITPLHSWFLSLFSVSPSFSVLTTFSKPVRRSASLSVSGSSAITGQILTRKMRTDSLRYTKRQHLAAWNASSSSSNEGRHN